MGTGQPLVFRKLTNSRGGDYKGRDIFNPYREPLSLRLEM